MKSLYIADLLDGCFPINMSGQFFVIGVAEYDSDEEEDEYTNLSLEELLRVCKTIRIVKRFREVVNPKYMGHGEEYQHILQPALIRFQEGK